ncbi:DUF397 domain-containing protein [Streptomyces cyaneofuscatus]|uniref:DUF397 domain-containing protein n=1 Tax=Streptomyces cyaneofuscatus TaxID=66883 RepID=UPI00365C3F14
MPTAFRKSSHSSGGQGSECLEVAHTADGGRAVRDSKKPAGGLRPRPLGCVHRRREADTFGG